jgi:hypothetical protein
MKTLPTQFIKSGFRFEQVKRIGNHAIYRKQHKFETVQTFEVIRIKSHNGYEIAGNHIEAAECYPSNEEWGVGGWTYLNLEKAEERFNSL